MAEIHDLRDKYPLLVAMSDNAGENKSKEIADYFTSMEVANRYSTAYEQHQDGSSESGIKSILLARVRPGREVLVLPSNLREGLPERYLHGEGQEYSAGTHVRREAGRIQVQTIRMQGMDVPEQG